MSTTKEQNKKMVLKRKKKAVERREKKQEKLYEKQNKNYGKKKFSKVLKKRVKLRKRQLKKGDPVHKKFYTDKERSRDELGAIYENVVKGGTKAEGEEIYRKHRKKK